MMTDDPRVARYADAAAAHARALDDGKSRPANVAAGAMGKIYTELRDAGELSLLLPLLRHADPSVRCWSATHLLAFAPEQAAPVLQALAAEAGVTGFNAKMVLSEWKAGRRSFGD
jgi:Domain of unknown function (DUF2019)